MLHFKRLAGSMLQVNTYPTVRGFTAIGTGGDDFEMMHQVKSKSTVLIFS